MIFPLLLICYYAFTDKGTGAFTFGNFIRFFSDTTAITTLLISLLIALVTTVLCILIAYPVAYILSRMRASKSYILVMLFVMPMWINFVLRAMALRELLDLVGLLGRSDFLNYVNSVIGMVYDFLPFMLLPIYTVLTNLDKSYFEASADLGANGFTTFFKVTLPLSTGGIMSGITMVFMPVFSAYSITNMMGDSSTNVIGNKINGLFTTTSTWGVGSALSFVLLVLVFLAMIISSVATRKTAKATAVETAKKGGGAQ